MALTVSKWSSTGSWVPEHDAEWCPRVKELKTWVGQRNELKPEQQLIWSQWYLIMWRLLALALCVNTEAVYFEWCCWIALGGSAYQKDNRVRSLNSSESDLFEHPPGCHVWLTKKSWCCGGASTWLMIAADYWCCVYDLHAVQHITKPVLCYHGRFPSLLSTHH